MTLPGQMGFFAKFTPSTPAVATYITTLTSSTNLSSYTSTGANIGTAAADRLVVLAITARDAGGNNVSVTSVTIGGVAATIDSTTNAANGDKAATFAYLLVPSGTTANIVVNFSSTQDYCGVHVYNVNGQVSNTPIDSDVTTSGSGLTLTTQTNGCMISCVASSSNQTFTWSGPTEDYDALLGGFGISAAHKNTTGTSTSSNSGGSQIKQAAIAFR